MIAPAFFLMVSALSPQESAAPQAPQPSPPPYAVPGEELVDPYKVDASNAGATPYRDTGLARAFHGRDGIQRIVDDLVRRAYADKAIGEIFKGHDEVRLRRTLVEQICYIVNAGCGYSGRDMKAAHKDLGVQQADLSRLVELLQQAMAHEGVAFAAQNKLLAKLAPMRGDVLER